MSQGALSIFLFFCRRALAFYHPVPVPTQEPKKAGACSLIRKMSFSRQKAEAKAFVQTQKQPADGAAGEAAEKPPSSAPSATPSGLVRKLSFGRKKTETP